MSQPGYTLIQLDEQMQAYGHFWHNLVDLFCNQTTVNSGNYNPRWLEPNIPWNKAVHYRQQWYAFRKLAANYSIEIRHVLNTYNPKHEVYQSALRLRDRATQRKWVYPWHQQIMRASVRFVDDEGKQLRHTLPAGSRPAYIHMEWYATVAENGDEFGKGLAVHLFQQAAQEQAARERAKAQAAAAATPGQTIAAVPGHIDVPDTYHDRTPEVLERLGFLGGSKPNPRTPEQEAARIAWHKAHMEQMAERDRELQARYHAARAANQPGESAPGSLPASLDTALGGPPARASGQAPESPAVEKAGGPASPAPEK